MKKGLIIGIAIPSVVALTFGIMTWSSYNSLVIDSQQVNLEQANIVTALNGRNTVIDNLIVVAGAYLDYELSVFEQLTTARASAAAAIASGDADDLISADALTSLAVTDFFAYVEDNPELQGRDVILGVMSSIETWEFILRNAREDYNDAATEFNTQILLFPKVLFARMFNYDEPRPLWQMTSGEDIDISFPNTDA